MKSEQMAYKGFLTKKISQKYKTAAGTGRSALAAAVRLLEAIIKLTVFHTFQSDMENLFDNG